MTAGLAESLRNATRSLHTEVERSDFMRAMLRGQMGRAAYCLLLRNLQPLYTTLELALVAHARHPLVEAICLPPLFRARTLELDLLALHGAHWQAELPLQSASQAYVQRLEEIRHATPELLVAHAYVRYLGDLSGGQQLQRIVARSLDLVPGHGTAFYDFGDAGQTAALARDFRAGLGTMPANSQDIGHIVAEAQDAFRRHGVLFRQLALASGLQSGETVTSP